MVDFGALFSLFLSNVWWVIPLGLLAVLFKFAWFKGVMGELIVRLSAKLLLNRKDYHVINNVTIPTEDGTTQIDHIIVSRFGVFVVETKNMRGWIFGGAKQKQWTQQIFKTKHRFQNPLHQNFKHTKTLEQSLGLDPSKIFSVVVFVGDSTFKTEMPENVTQGIGYIRFIKSKTTLILTESEVQQVIEQIEKGRLRPSLKTSREHAKHVRQIIAEKAESSASNSPPITTKICPKCGSDMILRTSKKGANAGRKFWGCSTFPRCRVILTVD
ncbi:MAG: nuclease [Bacteroidetes bacterium]|nr:MAG: nuclease [Bacteroidota bacterium]